MPSGAAQPASYLLSDHHVVNHIEIAVVGELAWLAPIVGQAAVRRLAAVVPAAMSRPGVSFAGAAFAADVGLLVDAHGIALVVVSSLKTAADSAVVVVSMRLACLAEAFVDSEPQQPVSEPRHKHEAVSCSASRP